MRTRSNALRFALQTVVAAYVLALAAMPFAHHDLVCHLKSSTHCVTCHVGTADPGGADPSITAIVLVETGRTDEPSCSLLASPTLLPSAGRSPPISL